MINNPLWIGQAIKKIQKFVHHTSSTVRQYNTKNCATQLQKLNQLNLLIKNRQVVNNISLNEILFVALHEVLKEKGGGK
jgi:hypothetical protein